MDAFDLYWQWANKHPESRLMLDGRGCPKRNDRIAPRSTKPSSTTFGPRTEIGGHGSKHAEVRNDLFEQESTL